MQNQNSGPDFLRLSTFALIFPLVLGVCWPGNRALAEPDVLEEVIVTAQKREQNLIDVPVAVTALDTAALGRFDVSQLMDVSRVSPSVSFTPQQSKMSNNPLRIRGMGASGTNPAFEGSVGVYVDGVYRSRAGMVLSTLNDVQSIQILRGPQGTLFGKNTSAGAVVVQSNEPEMAFSARGTLDIGNFDYRHLDAFVNGPVGDYLALRLAVLTEVRDGFITSPQTGTDFGDVDTRAAKFQARYDSPGTFSARLIIDYTRTDEQCCYGNTVRVTDDALDALLYQPLAGSVGLAVVDPANPFRYHNSLNRLGKDVVEDNGFLLDMAWDRGGGQLRSLSAWRVWDYNQPGGDADFGPVDLLELSEAYRIRTFSQEFNWSGSVPEAGGLKTMDYMVGAYLSTETIDYDRSFQEGVHSAVNWVTLWDSILGYFNFTDPGQPGFLPPGILATPGVDVYKGVFHHDDDVGSLYGHFTFAFNDHWNVVAGLRYSYEKKSGRHKTLSRSDPLTQSFGFFALGASTGGRDFDVTQTESQWTGNIALQYFTGTGNMVYGSYARGYKAGGISLNNDAGGMVPWIFSPTGFTPLADPRYQPEFVDAFEVGFKTQELDGRSRTSIAVFHQDYSDIQFLVFNASDAVSEGAEIENTIRWNDFWRSSLAVTYLNASYGNDPEVPANLRGRDLDHAPKWAGTFGLFYDQPFGRGRFARFADLSWSYMGKHFTDTATAVRTDAYNVVNLRGGIRTEDGRWRASVWCRNCTDAEYIISSFAQPFYFGGAEAAYIGAPRTWGLSVGYRYR